MSKKDLREELHDCNIIIVALEKRNIELYAIIERKTAIIDAIVFKDKTKLHNIKDFDAYQEFTNDIFNNPMKAACN